MPGIVETVNINHIKQDCMKCFKFILKSENSIQYLNKHIND